MKIKCTKCSRWRWPWSFSVKCDRRWRRPYWYVGSQCNECIAQYAVKPWRHRNRAAYNEYMKFKMRKRRGSKLPYKHVRISSGGK